MRFCPNNDICRCQWKNSRMRATVAMLLSLQIYAVFDCSYDVRLKTAKSNNNKINTALWPNANSVPTQPAQCVVSRRKKGLMHGRVRVGNCRHAPCEPQMEHRKAVSDGNRYCIILSITFPHFGQLFCKNIQCN